MATGAKFLKANDINVKLHLGKTKRVGRKEVELVITIPPDAAKNLARRLLTRFPEIAAGSK